jgi:DNA-binding transcriptional LysR family regulator
MVLPSLRQLAIFRTLMETQSVTETANRHNITQPAVSKMLAQLEDHFGLQLFHRSRGRLHPGPDADRLYVETQRLLTQLDAFNDSVTAMRSARQGRLSIAAIPTLAATALALTVARFLETRPNVRVDLLAMNSDSVVEQVLKHQVELGFVHQSVSEPSLNAQIVGHSEIVCVTRRDHRLAALDVVTPKDLRRERQVFLDAQAPPSHFVREAFQQFGIAPEIIIETNMSHAAKVIAQYGGGVALIDPWVTALEDGGDLATVAFRPRVPLRISCLSSIYRPRSRLADHFIADLKASIATLEDTNAFIGGGDISQ